MSDESWNKSPNNDTQMARKYSTVNGFIKTVEYGAYLDGRKSLRAELDKAIARGDRLAAENDKAAELIALLSQSLSESSKRPAWRQEIHDNFERSDNQERPAVVARHENAVPSVCIAVAALQNKEPLFVGEEAPTDENVRLRAALNRIAGEVGLTRGQQVCIAVAALQNKEPLFVGEEAPTALCKAALCDRDETGNGYCSEHACLATAPAACHEGCYSTREGRVHVDECHFADAGFGKCKGCGRALYVSLTCYYCPSKARPDNREKARLAVIKENTIHSNMVINGFLFRCKRDESDCSDMNKIREHLDAILAEVEAAQESSDERRTDG